MKPTKVFFETLKAYNDGYRTIVLKGSARSGKTVGLIQVYDEIASYSKKHRKLSIVSHSFPHLNDGAVYEYKKHQLRENIQRKHKEGKHEFYIGPGKSIINYFSLDTDGDKAIGPGRDILWINEPNRGVSHTNYTDLKTRTTECVFMDYNPSGEFWLHEEKLLEDPRTKLIHSTWVDNVKNLTDQQIQDFLDAKEKSKTSDYWNYWWKVYGLGEDGVLLEERIMPIIKWVKKVPDNAIRIPNALDFGWFPDPTAFCSLWVTPGKLKDDLYIREEVYGTNISINSKSPGSLNLTELLDQRGVSKRLPHTIAECADPGAVEELQRSGYSIESVVKMSVESSIRLFHDYNIFVLEGSNNVYRELDNYKFGRNKKGVIQAVPAPGQSDHTIDGIRYVLMSRNKRWSVKKAA